MMARRLDKQFRCTDCGRWISYFDITKTFDGCYHCSGEED